MGTCSYCGKKAGFMHSYHKECFDKYKQGWEQAISLASSAARGEYDPVQVKEDLQRIASESLLPSTVLKQAEILAFEQIVNAFLANSVLSIEDQNNLQKYMDAFELSYDELNKNGACLLLAQGAILRDLMEGKLPSRMHIDGTLPFNLQKNETIIWCQVGCNYLEEKTFRSYVGGYQGVGVKLTKGLYYRTGAFKGNPVETSRVVQLDRGVLAVTDKHVYFAGARKRFRVPYSKIISFVPYSDGFGLYKDEANSKQQIFVTGNGWFINNLLTNLSKREQGA